MRLQPWSLRCGHECAHEGTVRVARPSTRSGVRRAAAANARAASMRRCGRSRCEAQRARTAVRERAPFRRAAATASATTAPALVADRAEAARSRSIARTRLRVRPACRRRQRGNSTKSRRRTRRPTRRNRPCVAMAFLGRARARQGASKAGIARTAASAAHSSEGRGSVHAHGALPWPPPARRRAAGQCTVAFGCARRRIRAKPQASCRRTRARSEWADRLRHPRCQNPSSRCAQ